MKKLITILGIISTLSFAGIAFALPYFQSTQTMLPFVDNSYDLGTTSQRYRNVYISGSVVGGTFSPAGLGNSMLVGTNASGALVSTSTPTAARYLATSTTLASTFPYASTTALTVSGTGYFGQAYVTNTGTGNSFLVEDSASVDTTPFVIDNAGNVGIGTTSPIGKLAILDTSNTATTLHVQNDSLTTGTLARFISNNGNATHSGNMVEIINDFNAASSADLLYLRQDDDGDGIYIDMTRGGAGLTVDGAGNGYSAIFNNGNVGIGTTSPAQKLEVHEGDIQITGITSERKLRFGNNNSNWFMFIDDSTGDDIGYGNLAIWDGTGNGGGAGKSMIFQRATGNVGIATSSPNNKLDIYSTTKSAIGFSGASGPTYKWTMGMDVSNGGRFSIASSTALGTTDRFVIDGNGNVGIGTTTPSTALTVNGTITATTTAPTLTSCGTGPTIIGSNNGGKVTAGATAGGCTVTFSTAFPSNAFCAVTPETGSVVNTFSYTVSKTAIVTTETGLGGTNFDYVCFGY